MEARKIRINGVVQGVGFRPYVYRTASAYQLKGWVCNDIRGVFISVEGEAEKLDAFIKSLLREAPPAAHIKEVSVETEAVKGYPDFQIMSSRSRGEKEVLISPDLAVCADCRREFFDPQNRRYHYPLINCTNCGPRFTIIQDLPYDRPQTTMRDFPMCEACNLEYNDPHDRRFHAQPNACQDCGPEVIIFNNNLQLVMDSTASELLQAGKILAVKGVGGYHLVCDACNSGAVFRLRKIKKRPAKPLAVMAKDIDTVAKYCQLTIEAREILESPLAPILILPTRKKNLPQEVAPGVDTVGVMLPYTPLHLMLFAQGLELLVATSANISGEPLLYQDQSLTALADMADYLVIHNRRIYNRCDDSVLKVIAEKPRLLRRARGYVPLPLEIPEQVSVLACGGDLNNTFCLTEGREAFLSQHMGDLQNYNNLKEYELAVKRFCNYFNIHPELVIVDKHPGYVSHSWGLEQGTDYLEVQHHHAHLASCLADNGLAERILGVICDGTGYGQDGNLWGLEFLIGDFSAFQRVAHLEYVPQPGGERAIFEPLRMAISHIYLALGKSGLDFINNFLKPMSNGIFTDQEFSLLIKQIDLGINAPLTSSCGRLFDAVSALLGICREVSYEGEAAIKLEAISSSGKNLKSYDYDFKKDDGECLILIPKEIWSGIIKDLKSGRKKDEIAGRFHLTVVDMIVETCCRLRYLLDSNKVLLSGGVMQNKILVEKLVEKLIRNNFIPLLHSRVPSGDGGISLGQAVIGGRLAAICGNAP